jgi:hypothetical protein
MNLHANAKLGLAGRVALVRAIDAGLSLLGAENTPARSTRARISVIAASSRTSLPETGFWRSATSSRWLGSRTGTQQDVRTRAATGWKTGPRLCNCRLCYISY